MSKKKLNVTGSQIKSYELQVKDFNKNGIEFQRIYLSIHADNGIFKYEINEDDRFTIEYLKDKIPEELDYAIKNFNRVEISEYTDRNYLFFEVHHKDFRQMQVTGTRL